MLRLIPDTIRKGPVFLSFGELSLPHRVVTGDFDSSSAPAAVTGWELQRLWGRWLISVQGRRGVAVGFSRVE